MRLSETGARLETICFDWYDMIFRYELSEVR